MSNQDQIYRTLAADADAASQALARFDANNRGYWRNEFDPIRAKLEIRDLEARIALEARARGLDQHAPDLKEVRSFLEVELNKACDAYRAVESASRPKPVLAGFDAASLAAFATALCEYRAESAVSAAARVQVSARLSAAYSAAHAAHPLIVAARKAAGLPAPPRVLKETDAYGLPIPIPTDTGACLAALKAIASQRQPKGGVSPLVPRLTELKHSLTKHEADEAYATALKAVHRDHPDWIDAAASLEIDPVSYAENRAKRTAKVA
jgi:hypothetical protein